MRLLLAVIGVIIFSFSSAQENNPELEIPVKCPFEDIVGTKYVAVIYKLESGKYTFECKTGKKIKENKLFSSSEEAYKAVFDTCI